MHSKKELLKSINRLDTELFKICLYLSIECYVQVKKDRADRYRQEKIKQLMRDKGISFQDVANHIYVSGPRAWQILNSYKSSNRIKRTYYPKIMEFLLK